MDLHEPSDTMRMLIWDMNGRRECRRATWADQVGHVFSRVAPPFCSLFALRLLQFAHLFAHFSDQVERCDAVMFVIDCGDRESLEEAKVRRSQGILR
jgi:hypothetical protein